MSSASFASTNSLCPVTVIQLSDRLDSKPVNGSRNIGYWSLIMKISGEFSSCLNYIGIGELSGPVTESDIMYVEKNVQVTNIFDEGPCVDIYDIATELSLSTAGCDCWLAQEICLLVDVVQRNSSSIADRYRCIY